MKKQLLSTICLLLLVTQCIIAQTAPPSNLSGSSLRSWYKTNWYSGKHKSLGYSNARRQIYNYIDNKNNQIKGVYSGYTKPWTYGGTGTNPSPINCEHTVPQSYFGKSNPMRSDIHHLFPTYGNWNSTRSNHPFAEIPDNQTVKWMRNASSQSNIPSSNIDEYSEYANSKFEPREDHKGNVARAIFYFYTMYPTQAGNISRIGNINTLYQWHLNDPVDDAERKRNDDVEKAQGNRNPYIDYPNTVAIAWGFTAPIPTVRFTTSNGTKSEGASGDVTYTTDVEISPAPSGTITIEVQLDATGTTATTTDYSFTTQTLTFDASNTTRTINIVVKSDAEVESDETVKLKLANISAGNIGTNNTHTLTIKDTQPVVPTIQFASLTGSKQEGNNTDVTYTTQVSINPVPTSTVTVEVQLDATGTTATTADYSFSAATLTFTPSITSQNVSITIKSDALAEADETVKLKLASNTSGTSLGSNSTHTLTIKDNPPAGAPVISFDNVTGMQQEDASNVVTYRTQLSISPAPTGTVTIDVAVDASSTATTTDYELVTTSLTFSPSQTTQSVQVKVKADGAANENDETLKLILTNLNGTASVGSSGSHVLTIKDAQNVNKPKVFFTQAEGTVIEGSDADVEYKTTIKVSPTPTKTYLVELNIDATQTTATSGEDFVFTPVILSFSPDKTIHNISVIIKKDTPVEDMEVLKLKLLNPSEGLTVGNIASHTINIRDANPTGIQNVQIEGMKLYPNVSSSYINIDNERGFKYQYKVYDMQGRLYSQKTVNTSTHQLDVRKLPVGWYLITISNGKQVMRKRFAVVR